MARGPYDRTATPTEIPLAYAITRRYLLPPGSAAEFMKELEDETEEPTPALRALLREISKPSA